MSTERPLEGMKVALVCPTYGPVDPQAQKALRVAMMTASNKGVHWTGDSSPDKQKFSNARNMAVTGVLLHPEETQGIMWVDSDIIIPPTGIMQLLGDVKEWQLDFVTAIYHQKTDPYIPVVFIYDKDVNKYFVVERFQEGCLTMIGPDGGACGFGFCYTSMKMLKEMRAMPDFDKEQGKWFPDTRDIPGGMGEDFNFCDRARRLGYMLYLDTSIELGHMGGGIVYDRRMYKQAIEKSGGKIVMPESNVEIPD